MKTNREQKKEDSGVRVKASAKALRKRTALENWVQPSVTRRLPSMKSALHEEEAIAAAAKKTKKRCEVSRGRGNTGGTTQKQTHKVKEEGVQWQQTEAPLKCRWRTAGARGSTGGRSDSARRGVTLQPTHSEFLYGGNVRGNLSWCAGWSSASLKFENILLVSPPDGLHHKLNVFHPNFAAVARNSNRKFYYSILDRHPIKRQWREAKQPPPADSTSCLQ